MTMRARGYTLVEMVGVMAFAAVAAGIIYSFWPSLDRSSQQTRFFADLSDLVQEIRELQDGRLDYTGLSVADIAARGNLPARMYDRQTGALRTPWGDPIDVTPSVLAGDTGATTASAAMIRFSVASLSDAEKQSLCRSFMPRITQIFDTIDIGGSSLGQQVAVNAPDLPSPTQRTQIDALCTTQVLADPWMGGTFQ